MLRNTITFASWLLVAWLCHGQAPVITGYEYWFDQDDASRVFVPVPPGQVVTLNNVQLNTSALSNGTHQVHLRLKDQGPGGAVRWSSVVTRSFTKHHGAPWEITALRYWVGEPANDLDPGIRTKEFDTPQTELTYNGLLDLCDFPTGNQTLKLQLRDNHAQWSPVVTRSVNIQPAGVLGVPQINASQATFCPGDVVTLTATPPSGPGFATPTSYDWTIPSGNGWSHTPGSGNTVSVTVGNTAATVQVVSFNACGNSAPASLVMTIPAVPGQPSAINGPVAACIGTSVSYSVSQVTGVTYNWEVSGTGWSGSGTGATVNATVGTGAASITVTPFNSCGVPGTPQQVEVSVVAPPNAGSNGSHTACSNGEAFSLASYLGGSAQTGGTWSGPSTVVGGLFDPASMMAGTYTYTVDGTPPCPSASATVTVSVIASPVITGLNIPETVLIDELVTFSVEQIPGATYFWHQIPGSWSAQGITTSDMTATVGAPLGGFEVCLTVTLLPCAAIDTCFVVNVNGTVGIETNEANLDISVYPNPSNGLLWVVFDAMVQDLVFELFDATGRKVMDLGSRPASYSTDLSGLASGTYVLGWRSRDMSGQQRVVLQH